MNTCPMNRDEPSAATGVTMVIWSAASSRRFGQATCRRLTGKRGEYSKPLDAALPGRQAGQATKAVTSHRTPNLCVRARTFLIAIRG